MGIETKRIALILVLFPLFIGCVTQGFRSTAKNRGWRDPVTGIEFVKVPGGLFEVGCHANAGEGNDSERPTRMVWLDGFWLGRHEVTRASGGESWAAIRPVLKNGDDYPVEGGGLTFRSARGVFPRRIIFGVVSNRLCHLASISNWISASPTAL